MSRLHPQSYDKQICPIKMSQNESNEAEQSL